MRVVSADWVIPVEGDPIADGAVAIADDGTIADVGPSSGLGRGERFDGCAIVPGFVNCHTHLEYAVYAGFGDGRPFPTWIGLHVERKGRLDLEDMRAIATDGAYECLRSGITTVGDCSFAGAAADAAALTGLRAVIYLEVFGRDVTALDRFHELHERVAPLASDRLALGVSPHAPYTCTLALYEACASLGLPMATHFAESAAEREFLVDGAGDWSAFAHMLVPPPGTTGIRMLAEAGLLTPRLMAAHCVHVDADEIALLAEHGVGVAYCPRSNGMLGCGIAPVADQRTAGVIVAIATDSPASTPSFDMFDELRTAIVAARARERRPDALSAGDALELATLGGARVLGMADRVGSLAPGKQADLAVVSLEEGVLWPVEDPVASLVLGGSPERVAATLVAGEDRYRRGITEWPDSRRAARRARSRMLR
jgi:5-methylthioadenosine/S-adenosylhomocysteine deaminase